VKLLRFFWKTWVFHVKSLTLSGFFLLTSAIQPVIFASLAFLMWRAGGQGGTLLYVSLGAGLMGIWSSTLFGSGGTIQWMRWQGTLEIAIAAPARFLVILVSATLATASIGLYSLAATIIWGRLLFGVPFEIEHPFLFVLAIPATIIGLGLLGLVMASTFILYRHANAMSNLLEYPVWLITGLLVPLSLLPGWSHPLSWILAPTWGVRAIRDAALGGGDPLEAIAMCLVLGAAYLAVGTFTVSQFERRAREKATLSLT
jgi:ABC-2 type transport system permease protein